jgi:hypothetical protein
VAGCRLQALARRPLLLVAAFVLLCDRAGDERKAKEAFPVSAGGWVTSADTSETMPSASGVVR